MKTKTLALFVLFTILISCKKNDKNAEIPIETSLKLPLNEVKNWYGSLADSAGLQTHSMNKGFNHGKLSVNFEKAESIQTSKSNWWVVALPGQPVFEQAKQGYRKLAFYRDATGNINMRILEIIPDAIYLETHQKATTRDFTGRVFVYNRTHQLIKGAVLLNGNIIGLLRPHSGDRATAAGPAVALPKVRSFAVQVIQSCQWYESNYIDAEGVFTVYDEQDCSYAFYDDSEGVFSGGGGALGSGGGGGGDASSAPSMAELPGINDPSIDPKLYMRCFGTLPDIGSTTTVTVYVQEPFPGTSFNVGPNSVGHVAIGLTKSYNGTTITQVVGFYPNATGTAKFSAPSKLNDNSALEYNVSITYPIIPQQFNQIVNYINNPPATYNLLTFNCTNFIYNACQAGGITLPNPYQPLLFGATQAMSPGALGSSISDLNGMSNINAAGGTAPNSHGGCN